MLRLCLCIQSGQAPAQAFERFKGRGNEEFKAAGSEIFTATRSSDAYQITAPVKKTGLKKHEKPAGQEEKGEQGDELLESLGMKQKPVDNKMYDRTIKLD